MLRKSRDSKWAASAASPLVQSSWLNDVVATVPKGQRIIIIEVRDPWVGTYKPNGQEGGGSIAAVPLAARRSRKRRFTRLELIVSGPLKTRLG